MKHFIILILFFFFNEVKTKEPISISGKDLEIKINKWLVKKGNYGNTQIFDDIKYPFCKDSNLLISDISGSFNLIKVSCLGPKDWSFITRNKKKKNLGTSNPNSKKKVSVITLRGHKSAGSKIKEEDLMTKNIVIKDKNNFILEKNDIIGKKLKKSMVSGRPLLQSNIQKDWLIKKNNNVIIENRIGGIVIKDEGIAVEDADFMQKIRVKNIKSGKIIYGFAKNSKKVVLKTKQY